MGMQAVTGSNDPPFHGCFIVAPFPNRWRLFARHLPVSQTRPVERLWLEEVFPSMLAAWKSSATAISTLEALGNSLVNVDFALPRGAITTVGRVNEVRYSGGLEDWMHVTYAHVEGIFWNGLPFRWTVAEEFAHLEAEIAQLRELLGIEECWEAENSPGRL